MLAFISCAKTMARPSAPLVATTRPQWQAEAEATAMQLMQYSPAELATMLHVNAKIAAENALRYRQFLDEGTVELPALQHYAGAVFKRIDPGSFTPDDWAWAQEHLLITSFLYGLLRPADGIRPYRLEGAVQLPEHGCSLFRYWQPLLTEAFIERIKQQGGILLNLASSEMKDLFDWKKVEQQVQVITPDFKVRVGNELKTRVIYAKMCRGEMTRYFIKNRITDPAQLHRFEWQGFHYEPELSTPTHIQFTAG